MLYINDDYFTSEDVEALFCTFDQLDALKKCSNQRIGVCLTHPFHFISLSLYIKEKGGSLAPIHPSTPKEAALRQAEKASCHLLLYGSLEEVIYLPNDLEEQSGVLVQMSSGTTGEPKCIERSWQSIEEELDSYVRQLPFGVDVTPLITCPITHSFGLISGVLAALKRNVEPVIITNLYPHYTINKCKEYPKHVLYGSPTFIHTLVQLLPSKQRIHAVMTSGMFFPDSWFSLLHRASTHVYQQYGCSEVGCISIHPDVSHPSEMGLPLSHLIVETGKQEQPKEIVVQLGRTVVYTKDIGYVNEDGLLCLLGRMDDMINVAGLNVYPQEVEDVLLQEPRVEEAVVYKKADSFAGERVCVTFTACERIDPIQLREWCKMRLAPHQIPIQFHQVDYIPTLPNGKISRKLVKEMEYESTRN
ncbi:AMP-binding protein [Bacillus suaedaesalsae]|uniref:AMP-binding protein n=1 Tax=Bacillus suaedaesalsae TaxID=2810349 RepID=A0ABS2DKA7_9BACI|nr:AMP-binding protein [Bacillus suaedaesalsae]MBM6618937.1 AMP-binding protein [Bacillus suaedaesalsae]